MYHEAKVFPATDVAGNRGADFVQRRDYTYSTNY
jgi:hypothetical protein